MRGIADLDALDLEEAGVERVADVDRAAQDRLPAPDRHLDGTVTLR